MKLYLVYLGGRAVNCNIELHDVRFVIGQQIEDCYEQLRQQWFGELSGLHLDSYMEIKAIDGFKVSLSAVPQHSEHKLFFVNLGAYSPDNIAEQHGFILCVASSAAEAKAKAKQQLLLKMSKQHKDNLLELDDCFSLQQLGGFYIWLEAGADSQPMKPDWFGYQVIG